MKSFITFLFLISIETICLGQTNYLKKFKAKKFPCDTGQLTLEINLCSLEKLEYADLLLNKLYKDILKDINDEINKDQNQLKIEESKAINSETDENIKFFKNEISRNQKIKEKLILSQREWIKMRDLNLELVTILNDGGTSLPSIENYSTLQDILDRIKKLQDTFLID